jgi:hypothetical protein
MEERMKYGREVDNFFSKYEALTGKARSIKSIAYLLGMQCDTGSAPLCNECTEDFPAVVRAFAWRLADLGNASSAPDVITEMDEDYFDFNYCLQELNDKLRF